MVRSSLLVVGVLYGLGHPSLQTYRPTMVDRPLRDFHRELNQAAADSRRTLIQLDDVRSMRYLAATMSRLDTVF